MVSNVVCEPVFFRLNMTTIMVVTTTIYVNTTVTMTMTASTTMITAATKTMIMTMIATMIKNMTTNLTKNITISMIAIFRQVQKDNFYCLLLKMIKKVMKIKFALLLSKIHVV